MKPLPHWPARELVHNDDAKWDAQGQRFSFIFGSQEVQKVICGHAALTNGKYNVVFQRIMTRLVKFLDQGIQPSTDIADPVAPQGVQR